MLHHSCLLAGLLDVQPPSAGSARRSLRSRWHPTVSHSMSPELASRRKHRLYTVRFRNRTMHSSPWPPTIARYQHTITEILLHNEATRRAFSPSGTWGWLCSGYVELTWPGDNQFLCKYASSVWSPTPWAGRRAAVRVFGGLFSERPVQSLHCDCGSSGTVDCACG